MKTRPEKDLLGERQVPAAALHGINTERALENFPLAGRPVAAPLCRAYGAVKLACARVNHRLGWWSPEKSAAIEGACIELWEGSLTKYIVVDALQGGAGTATNMNVNEVLANRALQLLGKEPGNYALVNPNGCLNLHQSTNDTYPTALRVAAILELQRLEAELVNLTAAFQAREQDFAGIVKVARTEYQDAVLITLGREMGAYAEAFARDRWRLGKCEERLRVVNLGGTAVGTGLGAPRQFIFQATDELRKITGLGLARATNLVENTQNADAFVEVHGLIKTCAVNLLKVCGDLRFLASGPEAGINEIRLPARQAGSSIMPGKVNPVIPEAVSQVALIVLANDQALNSAASLGHLELNAFMPLIADRLLESLALLTNACGIFCRFCIDGLQANPEICRRSVAGSTAAATALIEHLGYETVQAAIIKAGKNGSTLAAVLAEDDLLPEQDFRELTSPEKVNRLGSANTNNLNDTKPTSGLNIQ